MLILKAACGGVPCWQVYLADPDTNPTTDSHLPASHPHSPILYPPTLHPTPSSFQMKALPDLSFCLAAFVMVFAMFAMMLNTVFGTRVADLASYMEACLRTFKWLVNAGSMGGIKKVRLIHALVPMSSNELCIIYGNDVPHLGCLGHQCGDCHQQNVAGSDFL